MTTEEPVVDVFSEEFQRNPYGVFREARARARCARDPFGSLILLRADDFEAVASDGRFGAFGDRLARMLGLVAGPGYDWLAGSLMFLDPPDHTRLRGFARKEFAQSSRGRGVVRRSTATSCRSTSNSASFEADDRPSRMSQPQSRTKMR